MPKVLVTYGMRLVREAKKEDMLEPAEYRVVELGLGLRV